MRGRCFKRNKSFKWTYWHIVMTPESELAKNARRVKNLPEENPACDTEEVQRHIGELEDISSEYAAYCLEIVHNYFAPLIPGNEKTRELYGSIVARTLADLASKEYNEGRIESICSQSASEYSMRRRSLQSEKD